MEQYELETGKELVDGVDGDAATQSQMGSQDTSPAEKFTSPPVARGQIEGMEDLGVIGKGNYGTVFATRVDDAAIEALTASADEFVEQIAASDATPEAKLSLKQQVRENVKQLAEGNRMLARKVVTHDSPKHHRKFRREVRGMVASSPYMPGIPKIYGARGVDTENPTRVSELFMETEPGMDLAKVVEGNGRNPLTLRTAADLACLMAREVYMAHVHGDTIHRDLKLENFFLTDSGKVRLLDLGMAKTGKSGAETTHTIEGGISGTPKFLSPEVAGGHPASKESDVFALGMALFKMFTGEYPYQVADGDQKVLVTLFERRELKKAAEAVIPYEESDPRQKFYVTKVKALIESMIDPVAARRPKMAKVLQTLKTDSTFAPLGFEADKDEPDEFTGRDTYFDSRIRFTSTPARPEQNGHAYVHSAYQIDGAPATKSMLAAIDTAVASRTRGSYDFLTMYDAAYLGVAVPEQGQKTRVSTSLLVAGVAMVVLMIGGVYYVLTKDGDVKPVGKNPPAPPKAPANTGEDDTVEVATQSNATTVKTKDPVQEVDLVPPPVAQPRPYPENPGSMTINNPAKSPTMWVQVGGSNDHIYLHKNGSDGDVSQATFLGKVYDRGLPNVRGVKKPIVDTSYKVGPTFESPNGSGGSIPMTNIDTYRKSIGSEKQGENPNAVEYTYQVGGYVFQIVKGDNGFEESTITSITGDGEALVFPTAESAQRYLQENADGQDGQTLYEGYKELASSVGKAYGVGVYALRGQDGRDDIGRPEITDVKTKQATVEDYQGAFNAYFSENPTKVASAE